MPSESDLIQQIQSHAVRLVQAVAHAEFWHDRWLEHAKQEHQRRLAKIEVHYQQALAEARSVYEATLTKAARENNVITQSAGFLAVPWDDALWQAWEPVDESSIPRLIRVGQLNVEIMESAADSGIEEGLIAEFYCVKCRAKREIYNPKKIILKNGQSAFEASCPLCGTSMLNFVIDAVRHCLGLSRFLPLIGGRNVLLKASGAAKAMAIQAVQSLMLRLLATMPPGKLRFLLIDPEFGKNVAGFVRDLPEELTGGHAWFEARQVEQQLVGLSEHMGMVIQKYLGNQYPTMEAYNAEAGEVAEPYRLLVVVNFPANFTDAAAQRLVNIAASGPRCGVYTLITVDTEQPLPYGFNLADLERTATVIVWDGRRFVWQDEDFKDCLLELDGPPPADLFDRILSVVGAQAKEASRVEVPFERIAPPSELWWRGDTRGGLVAPLGRAGATRVQVLDLGKGMAQHALVAGKTGSGKSTLLHTLIATLTLNYAPDELELYLVDFKKGVEFKTYAIHELPHARVVAIESEREFGLSVLQGLDAELTRRGDLFRAAGVDHIADYRQKTGQRMPRILLIVDEFQEFFVEDDVVASQASQILDRLVRQGRAFGIHVLLGSQTLAGAYTLARSTIDQMAVRIALQCSEADSRLILADDNSAARLLSRPGEAIYNDANGLVEGNNLFQVAWLPDDERDRYLAQVQALAEERGYQPPQPQIVFEGNAPAEVEKNRPLHDLLSAPAWPAPSRRVSAWLGEPIAIKDPTAAHFRRQSGSNLLIVGQRDEQAIGMLATALVSLAAQHAPEAAQFYVLDFSSVDASYAELFPRLVDLLPHPAQRGRRRELPGIIAKITAEVDRRLEEEETALWEKPTIYLCIYGLQRARDLRQDEFGFPTFGGPEEEIPPSPAQQFSTILREGPDLGVHTLIWCDTYTNLTRALDRRALREFEMRVVFQMSAEDSANLVGTPAGSKLGPYRALFYSEDEGRLEKFRPYGIPEIAWLEAVGRQLQKPTGWA